MVSFARSLAPYILTSLAGLTIAFVSGLTVGSANTTTIPPASTLAPVDVIQGVVASYIKDHPESILEAYTAAQTRQVADRAAREAATLRAHHADLIADPASPVLGDIEAPVTVVEFSDYRCPYCRKSTPALAEFVASHRIRVVIKELPILGPDSVYAAHLALAAAKHGRYADVNRALFSATPGPDGHGYRAGFDAAVRALGLDPVELYAESQMPEIEHEISNNLSLAEAIGVRGTPAIVIGDDLIPGAFTAEQLESRLAITKHQPT
jgi:protein-disulfide isomerase